MNGINSIKCSCGIIYKLNEFNNHFENCDLFYNEFKDFDFKIIQLLKQFINSKNSLIIIIFLLKRILKILKNRLKPSEEINPKKFKFDTTITSNLPNEYCYNYMACLFHSKIDDNTYAAYGTSRYDLECYDILNYQKFDVIKNLYNNTFHSCRHFFDDKNYRDLILTSFSKDNKIKVINFQRENSKVILVLPYSDESFKIRTTYFLNGNIIIPLSNGNINGMVKIYNMETKQQEILLRKMLDVFCINNYYNKKDNTNYTLICNKVGIFVYLINDKATFYREFLGDQDNNGHYESYILEKSNRLIVVGALLDTPKYRNLYFWDLQEGNLIKKVNLGLIFTDISIWNNNYIFASFLGKDLFALIDINKYLIIKRFENLNKQKGSGVKVFHDKIEGNFLMLMSFFGNLDLYTLNYGPI